MKNCNLIINHAFFIPELRKAKKDVESIPNQSKSLSAEYDRLLEEKDKLERKLNIQGGDKKDD